MGGMVVRRIWKTLRELPRDPDSRGIARQVILDTNSVLETVERAGVKLNATETRFFKSIPPAVGGAIRGAILDTLGTSRSGQLNFDVAYRSVGSGFTLIVSTSSGSSDVDMVLQAPSPSQGSRGARSGSRPKPTRSTGAPARSRAKPQRRPARKRGR